VGEKDAIELVNWITPIKSQVNLIAWNPIDGMPFKTPSVRQIEEFSRILSDNGIVTVRRMSRGPRRNGSLWTARGYSFYLQSCARAEQYDDQERQ